MMDERALHLTFAHWDAMRRHVLAHAPLEACGLLAGAKGRVARVFPVKNAAASAVRFRMDPEEQLRAFAQIESAGQELLAIFHSHPSGDSAPSPTDIREAAYPVVQIIWSSIGGRWQARGFWLEGDQVIEVLLIVKGM